MREASAREFAVQIVEAVETRGAFADDMLAEVRQRGSLGPRDIALTRQIVLGTLRRKLTLDCIVQLFSNRPLRRIQARPLAILRTAAYQIVFLDRIPAAAATDEAVKLAGGRAGGFVNAVLRGVGRALGGQRDEDPACSLAFAGRAGSFDRPVFPHPDDDLVAHLVAVYSHPELFVRSLLDHYGRERAERVLRAGTASPAVFVRPNTLKATRAQVCEELEQAGFTPIASAVGALLRVESAAGLVDLPAFSAGHFYIQDATAARVVPLLELQAGEAVLDVCAAPGGKCSQMAQVVGDRARIVAVDKSEPRLALVETNLKRLGIRGVLPTRCDMERPQSDWIGRFGKVLVDVPCSNSGVFARRPEARYRLSAASLASVTSLQRRLLEAASTCLKPGGTLVYSTCSVLPEENERQVERFARDHAEFRQAGGFSVLPEAGGPDGGYAARLIMI